MSGGEFVGPDPVLDELHEAAATEIRARFVEPLSRWERLRRWWLLRRLRRRVHGASARWWDARNTGHGDGLGAEPGEHLLPGSRDEGERMGPDTLGEALHDVFVDPLEGLATERGRVVLSGFGDIGWRSPNPKTRYPVTVVFPEAAVTDVSDPALVGACGIESTTCETEPGLWTLTWHTDARVCIRTPHPWAWHRRAEMDMTEDGTWPS